MTSKLTSAVVEAAQAALNDAGPRRPFRDRVAGIQTLIDAAREQLGQQAAAPRKQGDDPDDFWDYGVGRGSVPIPKDVEKRLHKSMGMKQQAAAPRVEHVERVAQVLQETPTDWQTPTPWAMLSENIRRQWRKKAIAALAVAPPPVGLGKEDGTPTRSDPTASEEITGKEESACPTRSGG